MRLREFIDKKTKNRIRGTGLGVDLVDNKTKGISTSNVTLSIGTIHSLMEDLVVLYITT